MIFNSIEFAIFLPMVFLLYWFVFKRSLRQQNLFIVAVSYLFYGWWDWRFLFLIAFTSLCSWVSGLLIGRYRSQRRIAKTVNVANIVVNLLILGLFKYYDFFAKSFAEIFHIAEGDYLLLNVILPVGISFYTFQALSYSIDVYRNKIEPTRDIVQFFAFVSFFPQLVAGPIERATNLLPQFGQRRTFDRSIALDGMKQILWGMFKKVVVADRCAQFVDPIFEHYQGQSGSQLMLGAILFSFQIYADFSGYSDIAIGTSKLFGIKLMRNFNVPYFSRDIAEFWRRWHISLTTWFRDYIYIPLGGSRCSKWKVARNTAIIFLVSGLWHGANWTYLAWGAYHALLFMPLILLGKNRKYTEVVAVQRTLPTLRELIQILSTFMLAVIGWIIFRAESITQAWEYIGGMWQWGTLRASYRFFYQFDVWPISIFIVIMLIIEWIDRRCEHGLMLRHVKSRALRIIVYYIVVGCILYHYGSQQTFIYFQF